MILLSQHLLQHKYHLKNCAPSTKCIRKIDRTTKDDTEDFNLVMPMYNLIEYILNYFETTRSLRFYSKNEATNFNNNIANTDDFKSFSYKAKLSGKTEAQPNSNYSTGTLKSTTIAVSLKYFTDFWRALEMPLISCKVEFKVKKAKYCVNLNGQNYMFQSSLYQQKIKNYQNVLAKDLKVSLLE